MLVAASVGDPRMMDRVAATFDENSMRHRRPSILLTILLFLAGGTASGETGVRKPADSGTHVVGRYGSLRAMFHEGRTGARVSLKDLLPNENLYALGAIADLAGEITVLNGIAYLDRPTGNDSAQTEVTTESGEGAALLVTAEVGRWSEFITERPIAFAELEEAIERYAHDAGIDLGIPFPFLLEGDLQALRWHVIDGRRLKGGGDSHTDHLAAAVTFERKRTRATLLGFYSASDHGVFTHMGSKTHVHCVVEDPRSSGHVDHVVIPAGATLRFPDGS